MDEYYGMKIKFMTRGGSIHGILKGLDEDKELFMIEIGEEEFKLDVNEVVDMEPEECGIEEDGCKEGMEDRTVEGSKENRIEEGSKVDLKDSKVDLKDSKVDLKEERPKVTPFKDEGFKNEDSPPIEKDVSLKDNPLKNERAKEEANPPTLTMPLKDNPPTPTVSPTIVPPTPTFSTPIPLFHYNSLLSLSFSRFGPTKEEFISISSLNLFKLLKSYFSFNSKIDIILGEDPLYNSIGLTLGRLFLNNDYDIRVVGSPRNLEIVNYHYLYRENKGITLKKEREDNEFVIDLRSNVIKDNNGSKNKDDNKDIKDIIIKKVIFTFGLIPPSHNNNNIFIHIALGLGILEFVKDLKEYFLIDGMINEGIYKKFGRTRKGMKSINRIRV